MSLETWAERAYDSYAATLGWRAADGGLLPTWLDLPEGQREAWRAAVGTLQEDVEGEALERQRRVAAAFTSSEGSG